MVVCIWLTNIFTFNISQTIVYFIWIPLEYSPEMRFSIICRISILEAHLYCIYKCKQVYAYFMRACMVSIYSIQFTWPFWPPPVPYRMTVSIPTQTSFLASLFVVAWCTPCSSGLKIASFPTTPLISILVLSVLGISCIRHVSYFHWLLLHLMNCVSDL